jgi:hypothetical protein
MELLRGQAVALGETDQLQDGIVAFRHLLASNRDGRGTAFTTLFTLANHHWVAPVRQSASDPALHSIEQQQCTQWMRQLNGTAGEFGGLLLRRMLAPDYVAWLEKRAELTNAPCPGLTAGTNRFLTSLQINCSDCKPLAGTAGDTHRDKQDDPLSYSISINASVLQPGARLGLMYFPTLQCAVRLRPGCVLVFQGMEPHRVSQLAPSRYGGDNDDHGMGSLRPGYAADTRITCILYPKRDIMNAQRPRTVPADARQDDRLVMTPVNLFQHGRNAFGGASVY